MSDMVPVRPDRCGLDELFLSCEPGAAERARLALDPGWTRQWTATWRVHGLESLEEQALLLALDFTGVLEDVLPQPFTLRFGAAGGGFPGHVPDFLAVFRDGSRWLLDVRPARLAGEDDAVRFAAAENGQAATAARSGGSPPPAESTRRTAQAPHRAW